MKRLYNLDIPIIALTGGIATGKSHVAKILKDLGHHLIDADKLVKQIYQEQETISWLKQNYPLAMDKEDINFKELRKIFFSSKTDKNKIEKYIYSHLERVFRDNIPNQAQFLIYDIPLLYEKNMQELFDHIILVFCSKSEQIRRLCNRDNIDEKLAKKILENQLDIDWKKTQSNYQIDNNLDKNNEYKNINKEVKEVINKIIKGLNI